jgi:hypothetical protein
MLLLALLILNLATLGLTVACESIGHGTGEAAEEVQKGAEDFEKGYEKAKED